MQGSHYFDDQHVLSDDLNNTEETKNIELRRRTLALITNNNASSGSVIGEYGSTSLEVTKDNDVQFTIAAGAAIDNQGEYIYLASNLTVNHYTYPGTNLEWSSDGSTTFYIKLNYVASSGSYKQDDLGNSYPTRYTDDYAIQVSSDAPSGSQVLLASFTAGGSGEIVGTTLSDERIFVRTRAYDDATYLGNSPIVGHTRVSDHIHAKGSGTQSTTNPHGLTMTDLGFTDESTINHWKDAHVNGIMFLANDAATLNSWSGSVVSPASAAYISFASPSVNAIMNVNGTLFSGSIANLVGTDAPSDGTFWVVADGTATALFLPTGSYSFDVSNPHGQSSYVRLGLATVADSGDDITSFVNMRDVFAMSQYEVRADTTEGVADPAGTLAERASVVDNLERIRYQLGEIIDGTPADWNVPPATNLSNIISGGVSVLWGAIDASSGSSIHPTDYPVYSMEGAATEFFVAKGKFIFKNGMQDLVLRCKSKGTVTEHIVSLYVDTTPSTASISDANWHDTTVVIDISGLTNATLYDWKVSINSVGSFADLTEPLVTIEDYSP